MAVAVQAVSTTAWEGNGNGETLVINKPTGTTDGDLLIAHIATADQSSGSNTINPPEGWTTVGSVNAGTTGDAGLYVYSKIASSEGASWSWSNSSGAGLMMAGAVYRIDGQGDISSIQIATDGDTSSDATPTFTNTVTPAFADSLLLFLVNSQGNATSGSTASYAITTSNPTWTERYDQYGSGDVFFGSSDGDGVMAGATASRPETTATGDSTCTFTYGSEDNVNHVGAIVVIPPVVGATVSPSAISLTSSVQAPTITGSALITPTAISLTSSVPSPTITTPASDWKNIDKTSGESWINPDKS